MSDRRFRTARLGSAAVGAGLLVAALAVPALAVQARPAPVAGKAQAGCASTLYADTQQATRAARGDTAKFEAAARRNGLTRAQLAKQAKDPELWLDRCGQRYFVEEPVSAAELAAASVSPATATVPLEDTFTLESKPGSSRTLYLDFDGATVTGTGWNQSYGATITATPFSIDSTVSTDFSDAELTEIQRAWQIVAEDYAPFDINVTTKDLGTAAIDRTDASDTVYGTRVVTTNGGVIYDECGCGGVAYVNVFNSSGSNHMYYQPAWVFADGTGRNGKGIAEAASHEAGHNFGLSHDGTATTGYYTGADPWAPIMGASYYQPVAQWSKGEYSGANQKQDDLAIIATGAPLRTDDHGNTAATATSLVSGTPRDGVVSTGADVDAFAITGAGATTVTVTGADGQPNLDVTLKVLDSSGATVATVNPAVAKVNASSATGLGATWTTTAPAAGAAYTLLVDGTGSGDPLTAGKFSDYGSLGNFRISLTTGTASGNTVTVTNPGAQTGTVGTAKSVQVSASSSGAGATLTYAATGLPAGLAINGTSGLVSGTPTAAGTFSSTVTATDNTGAKGSATFTWTIAPAPTACSGQLLANPGFESGNVSWTATSGVVTSSTSRPARTGSWKAWLNGYGSTSTDTLSQSVTIPAGCKATLSFWLRIDSAETTSSTAYDKLTVKAGATTLATYSNLNKGTSYVQRTFDLSAFAGQTVSLQLRGTEDSSLQTSFVVDDTAVTLS